MTRFAGVWMRVRFGRLRGWMGSGFVSRLMRLFVTAWSEEDLMLVVLVALLVTLLFVAGELLDGSPQVDAVSEVA